MRPTLLIDLDDTLLDFHKGEYNAVKKALAQMGLPSTDELARRYSEINDAQWKRLERGELTIPEVRLVRFEILFDELGLLESNAPDFQKAVLFHLAGEQRVIATVRNKPSPFLDRVRSLENCAVYRIDAENRNVVLLQILADLDAGRI